MEFIKKLKFDGNNQKLVGIFQKLKFNIFFPEIDGNVRRMKFDGIFQKLKFDRSFNK